MAISVVNTTAFAVSSNSGVPWNISVSPTNGNTLIMALGLWPNAGAILNPTIQDNHGNNFAADLVGFDSSGSLTSAGFFRLSNVSGVTTVTGTLSQNDLVSVQLLEISGLTNTSPLDQAQPGGLAVGSNSSNPWNGVPVTNTNANDIVIGLGYLHSAYVLTSSSPWTVTSTLDSTNGTGLSVSYRVVSATGTYTPLGANPSTNTLYGLTVSYQAGAAPPATGHNQLMMVGCGT